MTYQVPEIDQKIFDAAGMDAAELREHARRVVPKWDIAHRPKAPTVFFEEIGTAQTALNDLYSELDESPANGSPASDPFLELRENPRLLRAALTEIASVQREISKLPRVVTNGEETPRVAVLAEAYLEATKGVWNGSAQRIYIEAAQESDPLELKALWVLPTL